MITYMYENINAPALLQHALLAKVQKFTFAFTWFIRRSR